MLLATPQCRSEWCYSSIVSRDVLKMALCLQIAREFSKIPPIKRLAFSDQPWRGVLSMRPAMEELRALLPPTFEDLQRDFAVSVVGLTSSIEDASHGGASESSSGGKFDRHELIDTGSIAEAVVASAAVPVLFSPVDIPRAKRNPYMDGGVACRIGLDLWRRCRSSEGESVNGNGMLHKNGGPRPAVIHLIGRSSPFSGNDSLDSIGELLFFFKIIPMGFSKSHFCPRLQA